MLLPIATSFSRVPLDAWTILGPIYLQLSRDELLKGDFTAPQREILHTTRLYVGPFNQEDLDAAVTWLDQGALKAVFSTTYTSLLEGGIAIDVPKERVVLAVQVGSSDEVDALVKTLPQITAIASGILLETPSPLPSSSLQRLRQAFPEGFLFAIVNSDQDIVSLHNQHITIASKKNDQEVIEAFIKCLKSDRLDGLFTTVVTDTSGVALGLVYSSAESIAASVAQRRGIYYSRSRKNLWPKGDSSGHIQELVEIAMDCDSDALRFTVFQHSKSMTKDNGSFCHLETRTCWGPSQGIRHLQSTLQERKNSAPAGSYTKRLFDDMNLLRNKLVEEAQELAEATDPVHVAEEGADVLYFAMARCVAAGVSFQDIEHQLNLRALKLKRRPGNAKAYRIDAANAILTKASNKQ
ncbi:histidine biosynthesis trifunctional protein [Thraustotheca clavata]|uniref:Histidine biosynthesis trifunctional protein n=1 Tax=Thraustotheca clavata TaxID=74557 RepID=A0A1W0A5K4_9STRA|nr:histidine biosynthesis trifunctional protein [Thraustotheca clavata]